MSCHMSSSIESTSMRVNSNHMNLVLCFILTIMKTLHGDFQCHFMLTSSCCLFPCMTPEETLISAMGIMMTFFMETSNSFYLDYSRC